MYVNGFWLGVLMVIVAEIIFIIIGALINTIRHKDDEDEGDLMMTEEEFRATIENAIRASVDEVIREKFDNGKEE